MTYDTKKPREFWLGHLEAKDNDGNDYFVVTNAEPKVSFRDIINGNIHVIEKSAYDELQAQCEKLAAALEAVAEAEGSNGTVGMIGDQAAKVLIEYEEWRNK